MSDVTRYWLDDKVRAIIDGIRSRYEAEGFAFVAEPEASALPAFMRTYRPDAIATSPGRNVAIAVQGRRPSNPEKSLQQIRRLFESQPEWRLDVVSAGLPPMQIPIASPGTILDRKNEVTALMADGHRRAAFVMAWSLLEAASQSLGIAENMPRAAGSVLELLAREGYIEPDMERRIHPLVQLRNRIVHGDVLVEPSGEDVSLLLAAIDQTLLADAAEA